jgi:hypothetical protein
MGRRRDRYRVPGRRVPDERNDGDNDGGRACCRAAHYDTPSAALVPQPDYLGRGHRVCGIRSLLSDAAKFVV